MYDLQNEWDLSGGDREVPKNIPLQMLLNAPLSNYTSIPEADGAPFVSHKYEDTPHFASLVSQKLTYADKIKNVTSSWGESSPLTQDWNRLAQLTEKLITSAMSFDFVGVKNAIKDGADPNTLVLVKNKTDKKLSYSPAPLGVAVVLYAETQGRAAVLQAQETAQLLLTNTDGSSKIQVGAYNDSMAVSYPVVGIEWGASDINRQLPLTLAQANALGVSMPNSLNIVKAADQKIAYGEDLPKSSHESYVDMYEPVRDTLSEAVRQYRANRLNQDIHSRPSPAKKM